MREQPKDLRAPEKIFAVSLAQCQLNSFCEGGGILIVSLSLSYYLVDARRSHGRLYIGERDFEISESI